MNQLFKEVQDCKLQPFDNHYSSELTDCIKILLNTNFLYRPSCEEILNFKIFEKIRRKKNFRDFNFIEPQILQTKEINNRFSHLKKYLPKPRQSIKKKRN